MLLGHMPLITVPIENITRINYAGRNSSLLVAQHAGRRKSH